MYGFSGGPIQEPGDVLVGHFPWLYNGGMRAVLSNGGPTGWVL